MAGKEEFSTTMRIDITAHMPELADPSAKRKTQMLRVAQPARGVQIVGGKDFHELLQNLYDGALITAEDGAIVNANGRAVNFFRMAKEELCNKSIHEIIMGADEVLLQTILDNLKNNQFTLIQAFCVRKDETVFPAEISVNRLHLSNADYLSFFVRDITLRREAEDQLRTGFNAIQNSANGIAIADLDAQLVYLNSAMRALLGLPGEESQEALDLRAFLADPAAAAAIIEAVAGRLCWRGELILHPPQSSPLCVDASVAPNTNTDGDITGMVISLADITEKKAAQEKLELYARELADRNQQMQDDLEMARDIQEALLPRSYPACAATATHSKLEYAKVYYPSGAIGGDFFDVLRISDTEVGIFLCDVMGHGMRAALVVATIRGLIEQLAHHARQPDLFLTKLNNAYNAVFEKMKDVTFATAFYCVVNAQTGKVNYLSAGHPAPFIIRSGDGAIEPVEVNCVGSRSPAIGLFDNVNYSQMSLELKRDDLLLIYTDGLSEAMNREHVYYEDGSMQAFLRRHASLPPEAILTGLAEDALRFSESREFSDDVCLFAVKLVEADEAS